jgi:molybdenum cofactor cytidylyltransferase
MWNERGVAPAVVIPAAGLSSRMGRFKPLLPFGGAPLIETVLKVARRAGEPVVVVTGYRAEELTAALEHLPAVSCVYNDHYRTGMFSSIRCGICAVERLRSDRDAAPVFVALADMPWITEGDYRALARRYGQGGCDAVRFRFREIPGHPVLLSPSVTESVASSGNDAKMPQVLSRFQVCSIQAEDPRVVRDIDTPADWQIE